MPRFVGGEISRGGGGRSKQIPEDGDTPHLGWDAPVGGLGGLVCVESWVVGSGLELG